VRAPAQSRAPGGEARARARPLAHPPVPSGIERMKREDPRGTSAEWRARRASTSRRIWRSTSTTTASAPGCASSGPVPRTERRRRSQAMSAELLPESPPDRYLTDAEAPELLAVPKSWVGEAARQGRIRGFVMLGRYRRWDRADLLAWLEEQKGGRRR